MQISQLHPLDLCLLCLSTAAWSWIPYQDQVCTIDPVAIVTLLFLVTILTLLYALYNPLSWPIFQLLAFH